MGKTIQRLLIAVAIVLVVVLVAAGAWRAILRSSFPQTRGALTVPGLDAAVEVLRDRWGVPHITASSMHDLFFAQGFVTAQDRFWQMELWRRIGAGRLSELFGKQTLGSDVFLRTMGYRQAAERDYAAMDDDVKAVLQAYADGVNAYILHRDPAKLGLAFRLLRLQGVQFTVEPWVPVDTLTWLKFMAWNLGANMKRELYTIDMIQAAGLPLTREFFGSYRFSEMPVIVGDDELPASLLRNRLGLRPPEATGSLPPGASAPSSEQLAALAGVSTRLVGDFQQVSLLGLGTGGGIGSNDWVIAGSRTETGKPILANDPHLQIQMPSIWYEVDLSCAAEQPQMGKHVPGPYHVRGFSFAGVPGVIIGHNDRIAWGVTNVNPDVQDLYVERINPENPRQYEVDGRWVDMKVRQEVIKVARQEKPAVISVRETRHGPIITDQDSYEKYAGFDVVPHVEIPPSLEVKALSLRWTAFEKNRTMQSVLLLDQAGSFREFRDALRFWDVPSQNFVYADVDGNIGYQTPGLIPIRKTGDGSLPSPGWTEEYEWTRFIPFDSLPFSFNPPKGYIVTANNPVTSRNYRFFIGDDFDKGYRARRIIDMIERAKKKITVADVEAMQGDVLNISAREIIPHLKPLPLIGSQAEARDILEKWDLKMTPERAGAAVYGYLWQALMEETFKDKFPERLWDPDAMLEENSRLLNTFALILKDPHDPMWDKPSTPTVHETRNDILALAMADAIRTGSRMQGPDPASWRWGKVHTAVFRDSIFGRSGIPIIERIFNRGPFSVPGGFQQVFSTDWKPNDPFGVSWLSSMREIIDLADLSASVAIHTTGQSGHPGNRHYEDMIEPWRTVHYHPELWDGRALAASRPDRLRLLPR